MKTSVNQIIRFLLLIVLPTLVLVSCVEEYWPELEGSYENLLVVDGKITNEPGPYTIQLSNSSSLLEPAYNPLSGAIVIISDDAGNSETLSETSPGTYQTSETGIQGVIGRMYKLSISTDGKTYESEFEELLDPIGVESVTFKEESKKVSETEEIYATGYQFYLTTQAAINDNNYYYWEVEETYEYHAPYRIEMIYDGELRNVSDVNDMYALYYCWNTNTIKEQFTNSTEYLSEAKINNLPLHFISFEEEKLRIKYSVLAKQNTISKKAYSFIKAVQEINSSDNNLYVSQPYQIKGNMVNISDPKEVVLGYFYTAGISNSEHVFTPSHSNITDYEWTLANCYLVAPGGRTDILPWDQRIATSTPDEWPLYLSLATVVAFPESGMTYFLLTVVHDIPHCIDCRTNGGSTKKPAFWID